MQGNPWRSSCYYFTLSLPRTQVRSLVEEVKSHKPRSVAKKKILKKEFKYTLPKKDEQLQSIQSMEHHSVPGKTLHNTAASQKHHVE